jgi:uncharacterized repeat protein (TIGR03803 family)
MIIATCPFTQGEETMSRHLPARGRATPLAVASAVAALATMSPLVASAAPVAPLLDGYVIVHSMTNENGADGQGPNGAVVQGGGSDPNFYGTNFYLGAADFRCGCTIAGTAYRMSAKGVVTAIHSFTGPDGSAPSTALVQGADKLWYGLTAGGGDNGLGVAYKVAGDGSTFQVLHSFSGAADGSYASYGSLVLASDGNFYGTMMWGGAHGMGVVFQMTPAGVVTVIHAFAGVPGDGANPRGQLTLGADGNLYGTTLCGGASAPAAGCGGTVYKMTLSGNYTLLHSFSAQKGGYQPLGTVTEVNGVLYGTTSAGGTNDFGTIFSLTEDGKQFTKMYEFAGGVNASPANADGARPVGPLMLATDGNLYGTTSNGGPNTQVYPRGDGTIYRISTTGTYTLLGAFGASVTDGSHPVTGLTMGKDGFIYGTTDNGGANTTGTIFKFPVPAN